MSRRRVVAVIGAADADPRECRVARAVGRGLVDAGYRLVTGGRGGVMAAASRGARESARYREGDVVAILPGDDPREANRYADVVLATGLGLARNVLVVRAADAVVAVAGGSGTLSELALAWQLGRPVVALRGAGWSGRLADTPLDARRPGVVVGVEDADAAVQAVDAALGAARRRRQPPAGG